MAQAKSFNFRKATKRGGNAMKESNFRNLIARSRSYRRFQQGSRVGRPVLRRLVDLARVSASGANRQPLKYYLSAEPGLNKLIFPCLAWAGYLKDWPGPAEGERPAAYIIILQDTSIARQPGCDHGIAAQSIILGAAEMGLGGCIIGSVDRARLRKLLKLPRRFEILLVIALGRPGEKVYLEKAVRGNIRYWRDSKGGHHVPKRALQEIIVR